MHWNWRNNCAECDGDGDSSRRHPRLDIPLGCRFRVGDGEGWLDGQLVNLSAAGAALRTEMDVPPGTLLTPLVFRLPAEAGGAGGEVETTAVVVRRETRTGPLGNREHRLGLRFEGADPAVQARIRLFVFRLLQRAG